MNAFTMLVGMGCALGLWRVWRQAPSRLSSALVNTALLVLLSALIGARIAYIIANAAYFRLHLADALQLWQGGLSWPGAMAGAAAAIALIAPSYLAPHGRHLSPAWLADRLYPLLPPVAITAWLGCWQVGAAYGPTLPASTWWAVPGLDETGLILPRVPVQLFAALALLAFYALLELRMHPSRQPGALAGPALGALLLVQFGASLLRADPAPAFQGLRLDALFALAALALLLILSLVNAALTRLWRRPTLSNHS